MSQTCVYYQVPLYVPFISLGGNTHNHNSPFYGLKNIGKCSDSETLNRCHWEWYFVWNTISKVLGSDTSDGAWFVLFSGASSAPRVLSSPILGRCFGLLCLCSTNNSDFPNFHILPTQELPPFSKMQISVSEVLCW